MLRITPITRSRRRIVLKLEGRLISEWVSELERECQRWVKRRRRVHLDLAGVTFIDGAGAKLFHRLRAQGIAINNVPGLIRDLIQNHGSEGS